VPRYVCKTQRSYEGDSTRAPGQHLLIDSAAGIVPRKTRGDAYDFLALAVPLWGAGENALECIGVPRDALAALDLERANLKSTTAHGRAQHGREKAQGASAPLQRCNTLDVIGLRQHVERLHLGGCVAVLGEPG
jgi:hypothetical protein